MTRSHQAVHGGDVGRIARELGCVPDDLLDFSANLNPLGPPAALLRELARVAADATALQRYPEPDSATLRGALAAGLGIDPETIVVGNGAAALIETAIAALDLRRVVLPVPAFSEDARALGARGVETTPLVLDPAAGFALSPDALASAVEGARADGVLLTNPHNPSGATMTAAEMLRTLDAVAAAGARAIVDEAFVDFAPEASVAREISLRADAIAIRSLTKFYAVPGLRVGYAIAAPALARRMRALLPSWPVGTLETRALAAALGDVAYRERTLAEGGARRAELARALATRGFGVTPSSANFLLVRLRAADAHATGFTQRLARESRVVVRDCTSYDGLGDGRYVRVAVRSAADNARLLAALDALESPERPPVSGDSNAF